MHEKEIPFGTTHKVKVNSATKKMIVCVGTEINEGFILIGHDNNSLPSEGDEGTVVFTKGGPKGGYWKYIPNEKSND
jgi:hypothetical protein